MKNKINKQVITFLAVLIVLIISVLSLLLQNYNASGYSNSIDDIFEKLSIKPKFIKLETISKLYYTRVGNLSRGWNLVIFGKFSKASVNTVVSNSKKINLPKPIVKEYYTGCIAGMLPSSEILDNLKLRRLGEKSFELKDDIKVLQFKGIRGKYNFILDLLGENGSFILTINHYW